MIPCSVGNTCLPSLSQCWHLSPPPISRPRFTKTWCLLSFTHTQCSKRGSFEQHSPQVLCLFTCANTSKKRVSLSSTRLFLLGLRCTGVVVVCWGWGWGVAIGAIGVGPTPLQPLSLHLWVQLWCTPCTSLVHTFLFNSKFKLSRKPESKFCTP